jgi:hypothetical protein
VDKGHKKCVSDICYSCKEPGFAATFNELGQESSDDDSSDSDAEHDTFVGGKVFEKMQDNIVPGDAFVLDDVQPLLGRLNAKERDKFMRMLTIKGHHKGITQILALQNLPNGKFGDKILGNAHYVILMTKRSCNKSKNFSDLLGKLFGPWASKKEEMMSHSHGKADGHDFIIINKADGEYACNHCLHS